MHMFQTAPGCFIPYPDQLREEYVVREGHSILANISFPHLGPFVQAFYQALSEPLFFVLQLPLSAQEERLLYHPQGKIHQEVLYLEQQSREQIAAIMEAYGSLLLADGISQFAIASHESGEEIFVQSYKVTSLFSPAPRNLVPLLTRFGLREVPRLTTAWDTFTPAVSGRCRRVCYEGLDAWMVAEELKKQGMYRYEVIAE